MPRDAGACIQRATRDDQEGWGAADWDGKIGLSEGYLVMVVLFREVEKRGRG